MSLTGSRRPSWRYDLLDQFDRPLGALRGVLGGNVELAATTALGVGASLELVEQGQTIDWMSHRVRIWYDPGVRGEDPWALATLLFTSPVENYGDGALRYGVEMLGKLTILDEDELPSSFSLAAGAPIIPAVVDLIRSTGETAIAATDSGATLRVQYVAEGGTSKRKVINELLEIAGYFAVWTDGLGQFRVEPYVDPDSRASSYRFEAGPTSIHRPDYSREQDLARVPNQFVAKVSGTDTTPGFEGVAVNENPDSEFSIPRRGRVVSASDQVEAATPAIAQQLAESRLRGLMHPVSRLSVEHAIVPLDPNDLVEFAPSAGPPRRATVQRMSFDLGKAEEALCKAEWREVVPL